MVKSTAFGVIHLGIAFTVSYALTGSVTIAGAITFIEPLVNTVAHYFFDKYWGDPKLVARVHAVRRRLSGRETAVGVVAARNA